ncbi:site-specific integrase [Mycolicibacterium aubagnense]|nr:site-specific integrase [Mycolicibacterium aubagnense]WGI31623.1 site-specific integrase [Mycolicibacterium aubagnense]
MTRIVQRYGPTGDRHGRLAEEALAEYLAARRAPGVGGEITPATKVVVLCEEHINRLEADGKSPNTIETYRSALGGLKKVMGGVMVAEATPARLDAALRKFRDGSGAAKAKQARTILKGGLDLAVMATVLSTNPVRDVRPIAIPAKPKGANALDRDQLHALWVKLLESPACRKKDLTDPIIMFIATGLRESELLALRWTDYDVATGTIAITGKVLREKGKGLRRVDVTKSEAGTREIALPKFARDMLAARRKLGWLGEQEMIFSSSAGTWRDTKNFNRQWREVRENLCVPGVTTHSFRKTLATLIDEEGLSARVGADHLGHAKVSMTQDRYMARGRVHRTVADLMDRAINDE